MCPLHISVYEANVYASSDVFKLYFINNEQLT